MNDFNTAEYVVTQAKEGKNLLMRRLLLLIYFAVGFGAAGALIAVKLVPVVAVVPLLLWILVHFTWRKVNVEYKYVVAHSRVTFSECYSAGADKVTIDVPASAFSRIAPFDGNIGDISRKKGFKLYDYRGSASKTPVAVGYFEQNGVESAVVFIYDKKVASLLRLYNKNTEL